MSDHPCEYPEEMLSDLLDGELEPADKRRVAVHAAACGRCAQALGALYATRAALSVPEPKRLTLPRAFWRTVRGRLDQVDGLIRATDVGPVRRPLLSRPVIAVALAVVAVACVSRALLLPRSNALAEVARLHVSVSRMPGDPGGHQTVGWAVESRWRPVGDRIIRLHDLMTLQTVYDVGGLSVSVFRLPRGAVNRGELQAVPTRGGTIFVGATDDSSLVAVPAGDGWEVIIAQTPPDVLLQLMSARPRPRDLGPGL